jgi:hypothetical protein
MANYLIQTGNTRLLDTLDVLLASLLVSTGSRRELRVLVGFPTRLESPPAS